jgi:NOL1/NOP2/fmu family ribosome biogenesis protein
MTIPLVQGELNGIPPLAVRIALSFAHSGIWLSAITGLRARLTVAYVFAINSTGFAINFLLPE